MKIKMIVTDMDGTLLNSKEVITPKTLEALHKAQKSGIKLVIATGRHPDGLAPFAQQLKMDEYGGYLIGVNGGMLVTYPEQEVMFHQTINPSEIRELFAFGLKEEIEVMAVHDHSIYDLIPPSLQKLKNDYRKLHSIDPKIPAVAGLYGFIQDHSQHYPDIHIIDTYKDEYGPANKVCFTHYAEVINEFIPKLKSNFSDRFNVMQTGKTWFELSPIDVSKGIALSHVKDLCSIKASEIMVFGDGGNDVSMFAQSDFSVAMENALPSLKEKAWAITRSNDLDGIAHVLIENKII